MLKTLVFVLALATPAFAEPDPLEKLNKPPVGAIAPKCFISADLTAKVSGTFLDLTVSLVNHSGQSRKVTLTAPCPGDFATISGPEGFDPNHVCQRKACKASTQQKTFTVPAKGKPVVVTRTRLKIDGDACNRALDDGSTLFRASAQGQYVCSTTTAHVIREGKKLRVANGEPPR